MPTTLRTSWKNTSHEKNVEHFYSTGIEGFHDYHNGYLCFGYWTNPNFTYLEAAENLVKRMGEELQLNQESELLDIGFGMGTQDIYLTKNFAPKKITGLDVTWKHVYRAQERAARNNIPTEKLEYHHGTAVDLPFQNNSFTHLLSIEAPEHFHTREKFFHEAARVLKPGGTIALCDYGMMREPKNMLEKLIFHGTRKLWQVPKENVYDMNSYKQKLQNAGFTNISIHYVGKDTIPGYYFCHRRPEEKKEAAKVRGWLKGIIGGWFIDFGVYKAFTSGMVEYLIVRAEKTKLQQPA